jgi:hypothetical protein
LSNTARDRRRKYYFFQERKVEKLEQFLCGLNFSPEMPGCPTCSQKGEEEGQVCSVVLMWCNKCNNRFFIEVIDPNEEMEKLNRRHAKVNTLKERMTT